MVEVSVTAEAEPGGGADKTRSARAKAASGSFKQGGL